MLVSVLFLFVLSGCDKNGKIWDVSPVVVNVSVTDPAGKDLLNPANANSLDVNNIKAVYKGVIYQVNSTALQTKAYMPRFYGLRSGKQHFTGVYILEFGEFDGSRSYDNEEITLIWEDGSSDKISFSRTFKWKANGEPKSSQEWFLNGTEIPAEDMIRIVK